MDLFSGFYKNTMECPNCDKVSVTFDPYSLLTVQLPMDHAFQHLITFVPLYGKPIMDGEGTLNVRLIRSTCYQEANIRKVQGS